MRIHQDTLRRRGNGVRAFLILTGMLAAAVLG